MAYRSPPPNTTDVGRTTPWGNPYRVGTPKYPTAGSTIPAFEVYARARLLREPEWLEPLVGKTLWCPGCGLHSPTCHARVLERLR